MGLRPLSRDISSGFSDSLFFPSALFNSLVRRAEAAVRPEPGIVAGTTPRNTQRTLKRIHWLHGIQELTGYANSHIFFVVALIECRFPTDTCAKSTGSSK